MNDRVAALLRRAQLYLDDHWMVRWFAVPVLVGGWVVAVLTALFATPDAALTVALAYVVLSFVAVAAALLVERVVAAVTGTSLLASDEA